MEEEEERQKMIVAIGSSRLYETLKWLGLIGAPLLAIILGGLGPLIWNRGLEASNHSMLVVNIVALSMGIILAFCQDATFQDMEKIQEEKEEEEENVIKDS